MKDELNVTKQEEKGTTEDETAGWHQRLKGYEFEQTPGDSEGQGCLVLLICNDSGILGLVGPIRRCVKIA